MNPLAIVNIASTMTSTHGPPVAHEMQVALGYPIRMTSSNQCVPVAKVRYYVRENAQLAVTTAIIAQIHIASHVTMGTGWTTQARCV